MKSLRVLRLGGDMCLGSLDPPLLRKCQSIRILDIAPVAISASLSTNQIMRLVR